MKDNIIPFPNWAIKVEASVIETLEAAKGWDFDDVIVVGVTKSAINGKSQGGSIEGTIICSSNDDKMQTSRNLSFIGNLCNYLALKKLGFYE